MRTLAPVIPFEDEDEDEDEGMCIASGTQCDLAGFLFTQDTDRTLRLGIDEFLEHKYLPISRR